MAGPATLPASVAAFLVFQKMPVHHRGLRRLPRYSAGAPAEFLAPPAADSGGLYFALRYHRGGPAAAVVFPRLVKKRVQDDARIQEATARLSDRTLRTAAEQAEFAALYKEVEAEIQGKVAAEFDAVHSVERAMEVGSLSGILEPDQLRTQLHRQLSEGLERYLTEKDASN